MPTPRTIRIAAYSGYLLFAVFVLLGAIEVICRSAGFGRELRPEEAHDFLQRGHDKFEPDAELIWVLRSNWVGREPGGPAVRTNDRGLRGGPIRAPEEGRSRILFLGDSVTYGHNLRETESIPYILGEMLKRRLGWAGEVINAGVPGYSTFQEVAQFERHGRALAPDLVLLGLCLNDATERYQRLLAFGGERFFMGGVDTATGMGPLEKAWYLSGTRGAIAALLRARAEQGERHRVSRLWREPSAPDLLDAWETVFAELRELIAAARALATPIAVVVYPYAEQFRAPAAFGAPQARVVSFLEGEGVPVLDLLRVERLQPSRAGRLFFDANHFTPRGAGLAARAIADFLIEEKLLDGR